MKLHELGALRQPEQISQVIENYLGKQINFHTLSPTKAAFMLDRVRKLVKEHRNQPSFHRSEKNPAYLQLVMMEQALASRVGEQATGQMGAAMTDPKAKAVMDKVQRKQPLTPEEQQTVNLIAMTKENKKARRMVRESEIQTAQVVLAAQDMVDRIQGMMEDISEMQFKDLPALVNSIRNDMGADQATQFQAQASAALSNLLTAVQSGKTEMESAQGVLTGQAPVVPGQDTGMAAPAPAGGEQDVDLSLDANLPADDEEEEPAVDLGRERR